MTTELIISLVTCVSTVIGTVIDCSLTSKRKINSKKKPPKVLIPLLWQLS